MSRILIRGANWIGDAVLSLAALRELRRLCPGSRLTLLVRTWVAGLFEGQGTVDEIITFEDHRSSLAQVRDLAPRLRGFDQTLLFPNSFQTALVAFLARIPERMGYRTEGRGLLLTRSAEPRIQKLGRHQVYHYLDLLYQTGLSSLDYLGAPDFTPDIRLRCTSRALGESNDLLQRHGVNLERPLVALNPGAYFGPAKRWLTDRYAALADRLIRHEKAEVLILGSPGELPIARSIESQMKEGPRILTGQTGLASLMGVISRCRLLITNDSGPMHLAAALEVPQIALFGSTDDRATGPFSKQALVIHKHVECSPCLLRECPIDLRCFRRIEVDEVYEAARRLLSCA